MRPNAVKKLLRAGKPAVGTWLTLGNIPSARFLARSGFDWLTVDIEHSAVDIQTASTMLGAIADAGVVALARVPSNSHEAIKRVLDNGGHGVVHDHDFIDWFAQRSDQRQLRKQPGRVHQQRRIDQQRGGVDQCRHPAMPGDHGAPGHSASNADHGFQRA